MKKTLTLSVLSIGLLLASCKKDPVFHEVYYSAEQYELLKQYLDLPEYPLSYNADFPPHLQLEGLFQQNIDAGMATLGRVLFYDKKLSSDESVSCASCHRQDQGFSDNVALSRGVLDRQTTRNSYPLGSVSSFAATYDGSFAGSRFFWDNRATTVAEQSRETFGNPREMNIQMHEVVRKVREQPFYAPLFEKAFGKPDVSEEAVLTALTMFVNSLGAFETRFDAEVKKLPLNNLEQTVEIQPFAGFTAAENRGKELYMLHCQSCHGRMSARASVDAASNGIDATTTDLGMGAVFAGANFNGVFKVPTLRNVALTAPYMHDGRFATLDDVIEHYNSGILDHPNLHAALKQPDGKALRLNLSADDKQALVAFLHTLTDEGQRTDVRFADPFK